MFASYVNSILENIAGKMNFLPFSACPSRYIELNLQGMKINSLLEDECLNQGIEILAISLKRIYKIYRKDWLFHEPILILIPDTKILVLKIGMIEKKRWKEINKRRNKNDNPSFASLQNM